MSRIRVVYARWAMRRAFSKFFKSWSRAEEILSQAGVSRGERRRIKRDILAGRTPI